MTASAAGGPASDNGWPHPGARPFLKWAGGKTQLLGRLAELFPPAADVRRYVEPFVGSGAVFFMGAHRLRPRSVILADGNADLILLYRAVRDDVEGVMSHLTRHKRQHGREHYYKVRAADPSRLSRTGRAARFIYLNKTCFNGLYRLNSRGEFNVPMGRYANPPILDREKLRAASLALKKVTLKLSDFRDTPGYARAGDFIYLDPPYQPLSRTSSFTSYTGGAFTKADQADLAEVFAALDRKGCLLMLSNSASPLIRKLYASYRVRTADARRSINSRGDRRGPVKELVITNY